MTPSRQLTSEESIVVHACFSAGITEIVPARLYKRAPGGVWYRQSRAGGYKRIKSRQGVLRLQGALTAGVFRPE